MSGELRAKDGFGREILVVMWEGRTTGFYVGGKRADWSPRVFGPVGPCLEYGRDIKTAYRDVMMITQMVMDRGEMLAA